MNSAIRSITGQYTCCTLYWLIAQKSALNQYSLVLGPKKCQLEHHRPFVHCSFYQSGGYLVSSNLRICWSLLVQVPCWIVCPLQEGPASMRSYSSKPPTSPNKSSILALGSSFTNDPMISKCTSKCTSYRTVLPNYWWCLMVVGSLQPLAYLTSN